MNISHICVTFPYPMKDANNGDPQEERSVRKARFTNTTSYINKEKDVDIMYTPGIITPSIDWTTVEIPMEGLADLFEDDLVILAPIKSFERPLGQGSSLASIPTAMAGERLNNWRAIPIARCSLFQLSVMGGYLWSTSYALLSFFSL